MKQENTTPVFMIRAGRLSIKSQSNCESSLRLARAMKKGAMPDDWKALVHEVFQTGDLYEKSNHPFHSDRNNWHPVNDRVRAVFVADCVTSEGFRPELIETF